MKVDTDGKVLVGEDDASSVPHVFSIGDAAAVSRSPPSALPLCTLSS